MRKMRLKIILGIGILAMMAIVILLAGGCAEPSPHPATAPPSGRETVPPESKPSEVEGPKAELKIIQSTLVEPLILGEVENVGGQSATDVSFMAKFYDDRGYLLGQEHGYLCGTGILMQRAKCCSDMDYYYTFGLPELRPGYKAPFAIHVGLPLSEYPTYTYTLEVTYDSIPPSKLYAGCKILSVVPEGRDLKTECYNGGNEQQGMGLLATFYDSQGKVVSYQTDFVCLLPNQVKTISLSSWARFASYPLSIVCTEPCD